MLHWHDVWAAIWVNTARRASEKKSRWVRWANSARTIAGEKLSSEREKKLTRKKRDPNLLVSVFCYDIVYISNVSKTWKGKQGETVRGARGERAKRSGRWEGCKDESAEIGGRFKKNEGAEPEPPPHISRTAFKFLSAADGVLHVFMWTWDRKLTHTVKRPHKENICRRVVARKRIDRVIILSKSRGKIKFMEEWNLKTDGESRRP